MPRSLSSAWTFFYKFLLPPFFLVLFAVPIRSALVARGVYSHAHHTPIPLDFLALGVILLAAIIASVRLCMPLKRVRLSADGGALLVSNFLQEWTVPVALIENVSQNHWTRLRPISVRFRSDPGCGRSIVFMPPLRMTFRFWRDDPEADELRSLAAEHSLL
jgi:hypothetical protein